MAVYRMARVGFWLDDFVMGLSAEERYFYLYLLTCTKTTQYGIFPLNKSLASFETGYDEELIDKLLQWFMITGKVDVRGTDE